jgi:hypothetical protein
MTDAERWKLGFEKKRGPYTRFGELVTCLDMSGEKVLRLTLKALGLPEDCAELVKRCVEKPE